MDEIKKVYHTKKQVLDSNKKHFWRLKKRLELPRTCQHFLTRPLEVAKFLTYTPQSYRSTEFIKEHDSSIK